MKSYHHPNVLPLYTSFVHEQDLWMVTPFMSGGSILHIMKYRFPKVQSSTSTADGHSELAVSTTAATGAMRAHCLPGAQLRLLKLLVSLCTAARTAAPYETQLV
jgi:serine/threonine protein kinase